VLTLIRNGIVLPMRDGERAALDPGSVLIDGDRIVAVDRVDALDADRRAAGAEVVANVRVGGNRIRPVPVAIGAGKRRAATCFDAEFEELVERRGMYYQLVQKQLSAQ